jgi:phosphoenolpyruvate carboxylase
MTSWHGLGSTLEKLKQEKPEDYEMVKKGAVEDDFISYLMGIIRTGISFSNEKIMKDYASLVKDEEVRNTFLTKFISERDKTLRHLSEIYGVGEDDAIFQLERKRQELLAPLHKKQMDLLQTWREQKQYGYGNKEEELLMSLLLSINAISGVMGYTG